MSFDTLQTINFAGKDGFQWFFAKVVPQEHWKSTADALNYDGKQSHRAKIRVCGYDTFDESELPDEDCRWAQFLLPAVGGGAGTSGTANQNSNYGVLVAGHGSAVATAEQLSKTETYRDPDSFADIVRGMHLYGRKILRPEAIVTAKYNAG